MREARVRGFPLYEFSDEQLHCGQCDCGNRYIEVFSHSSVAQTRRV